MKKLQVLVSGRVVYKSIRQASFAIFNSNRMNQIRRAMMSGEPIKGISFELYEPDDMEVVFYDENNPKKLDEMLKIEE